MARSRLHPSKGSKRFTYYEIGFPTRKVTKYEKRGKQLQELLPLGIIIGGLLIGHISTGVTSLVDKAYAQEPLISPYIRHFESYIPEPVVVEEKPKTIEEIVVEVFEDKSDEALLIMNCESRGNPEIVGDTHIMSVNNKTGELIGDSIGLFQIRTGSTNWNRASANGMTADEFRSYMKVPENNIRYAKEIYDNSGSWKPWFNCMQKVLSN